MVSMLLSRVYSDACACTMHSRQIDVCSASRHTLGKRLAEANDLYVAAGDAL